uniref:Nuclear pore complex protein Nup85 n=1 Tax=Attheya septentrionalis TaxID=420275 RepID=A0A7S2XQJ6_9STRA
MSMGNRSGDFVAVAWDPSSPSTLFLPPKGASTFPTFLADDGVGCNAEETTALLRLLDARQEIVRESTYPIRKLSKRYRLALRDCLSEWEDRLQQPEINAKKSSCEQEETSLEQLKLTYAVTQLVEVYVLPVSTGSLYTMREEDVRQQPGAATADTVRYLRLHHMTGPYAVDGAPEDEITAMLNAPQPEYFRAPSYSDDDADGFLFWDLVKRLVLRGCLEEAWAVLGRHSAVRNCADPSSSEDDFLDDSAAFAMLRALLLSAPLPGGRNDNEDSCLAFEDEDFEKDEHDLDEVLLEGVAPSTYQLWDIATSHDSKDDYPAVFQPSAASAVYKTWQRAVSEAVRGPMLAGVLRRIPLLKSCVFTILLGHFQDFVFDSWPEALCAELLYVRPLIRMGDVSVRAARTMSDFGHPPQPSSEGDSTFEEIVLNVMRGNAGSAVMALHKFGGGSGAALPATMVALLCNLLNDADLIPSDKKLDIRVELLIFASQSILSSLSSTHADVGAQLATQLLIPHATPRGNARITATLAEHLEHHYPCSDVEAFTLLQLCEDLVRKGSRVVLDACLSLCMARHEHYASDDTPGGAIFWLLRGIECWSKMLVNTGVGTISSCDRKLRIMCASAAQQLLRSMVEQSSKVTQHVEVAHEIVKSIKEDETMAGKCGHITEVRLLNHVVSIAMSLAGENAIEASRNIVCCLEDFMDEEDNGVVKTLASRGLYKDLMILAYSILDSEQVDSEQDDDYKCAFSVFGIHTLMARLSEMELDGTFGADTSNGSKERTMNTAELTCTESLLRLALCKGLMRSFVCENESKTNALLEQKEALHHRPQTMGIGGGSGKIEQETMELMLGLSM